MTNVMEFPETVEEFMELYRITDTDHVYSNGTDYVPIFRMKQWFEHLQPKTNADRIRSMSDEELAENLMKAYDCPKGKDCVEQMPGEDGFHQCKRCWVEWLRQECAE